MLVFTKIIFRSFLDLFFAASDLDDTLEICLYYTFSSHIIRSRWRLALVFFLLLL
jgi:hypothetical protein